MGKTTNILDLNNRLTKVEKENVAQNSYTSLKNKPKINNVTLTGNKSLADIGAAGAADLGDLTDLTTTDKSSCVGAINEVNGKAGTFGPYTVDDATDIKDFIKKTITLADADLASKPALEIHHIFLTNPNVDRFYGTIERQDTHGYSFVLNASSGSTIYQGYCDLSKNHLQVYSYSGTVVS